VDYAATEKAIAEQTAAVERAAHVELLRALDVDAPQIRVRGKLYGRFGREPGRYSTMAGEVVVERTVYRPVGERNGRIESITLCEWGRQSTISGALPQTPRFLRHGSGVQRIASTMQCGSPSCGPNRSARFRFRFPHIALGGIGKHYRCCADHAKSATLFAGIAIASEQRF